MANGIEGEADNDLVDVPAKDTASFDSKEQEHAISRPPAKADPLPLHVPDPFTKRPDQKATTASKTSALANAAAPNDVTTMILLRPYNDEEDVSSDELHTPLNPISRAEEDVFSEDAASDGLRTPPRALLEDVLSSEDENEPLSVRQPLVPGQLSPLLLSGSLRLADPLARVAQDGSERGNVTKKDDGKLIASSPDKGKGRQHQSHSFQLATEELPVSGSSSPPLSESFHETLRLLLVILTEVCFLVILVHHNPQLLLVMDFPRSAG